MDIIKLAKEFRNILDEEKWSADVETKWNPPKDFFKQSASNIASGLMSASGNNLKTASSRLNFYINRAGKNLSSEDRKRLEAAKKKLSSMVKSENVDESVNESIISRMAEAMISAPKFEKMLNMIDKHIGDPSFLSADLENAIRNALIMTFEKHKVNMSGALSSQAKRDVKKSVSSM